VELVVSNFIVFVLLCACIAVFPQIAVLFSMFDFRLLCCVIAYLYQKSGPTVKVRLIRLLVNRGKKNIVEFFWGKNLSCCNSMRTGLEIATNTVANATNISSLATKFLG